MSVSMEIVNGRGTVLALTGPDVVVALAPSCAPPTADGGVP